MQKNKTPAKTVVLSQISYLLVNRWQRPSGFRCPLAVPEREKEAYAPPKRDL